MGYIYLLLIILFSFASSANARPVSYSGATMVMTEIDHTGQQIWGNYSPTAKYSIGAFIDKETGGKEDYDVYGVSYSHLLKRWNMDAAQANIFLTGRTGVADLNDEGNFFASSELAADYETRRVYFAYMNSLKYVDDVEKSFEQRFRAGVAPILAEYGDLQPWLIMQADHHPTGKDEWVITPLIRVYYTQSLAEFGISNNKDVLFNLTLQF